MLFSNFADMMKTFFASAARAAVLCFVMLMALGSCHQRSGPVEGICRIHGTMESGAWDGKRIFLVPMEGLRDAAHVDSVVIKDGQFEFTADTVEMKIVRLDYHFRKGAQDLLVVTEPGDLKVFIGSNSVASGTPQNDSMQVWKDYVMLCSRQCAELRKKARESKAGEDVTDKVKEIQRRSRQFTRLMAERMPEGVFKDYLNKNYPPINE